LVAAHDHPKEIAMNTEERELKQEPEQEYRGELCDADLAQVSGGRLGAAIAIIAILIG
jgi:hypothetical protein